MVLLELGGAFSAALAIEGGQIVDGMGGSSGPLGVRAAGALDGELAYLLAPALSKRTLYHRRGAGPGGRARDHRPRVAVVLAGASGRLGGVDRRRRESGSRPPVSVPAPHEIVVSGRLARVPELVAALGSSLRDIAPVVTLIPGRASSAAYGGALLADALAGGPNAALADVLRLRESAGTALDHVRVAGGETISLG